MKHTCKAFVVHCMDFRFEKSLFSYLEEQHLLGDCDIVGWAGSAKAFIDEATRAFAMRQLELSHALHATEEVHLIQHLDCGAYGGSQQLGARDKEIAFQTKEIEKATKVIHARYPNIRVVGHLAELNSQKTVDFINMSDRIPVA